MRQITKYRITVAILVAMLVALFCFNEWQFNESMKTIETYSKLVDKQRNDMDDITEMWESSYDSLQSDYADLLVENDRLKESKGLMYSFTQEEIILLAKVVQTEAGTVATHHEEAQKYVCQVILNRLGSEEFPDTLEEVIYQKVSGVPQFSVAYNGMLEKCNLEPLTLTNVYDVLLNGTDLPENIMYFYSSSVEENWVNTLATYDTVQGTVFAYEED